MSDRQRDQAIDRKASVLETIRNQHQENLKACEQAYAGTPYLDEGKKAAARVMHEAMVESLKK
jgi:hypothetical protein